VSLGRLPGVVVTSQPAGRRIPLRLWLVSGDALGERDGAKIGGGKRASTYFDVMGISLVIAALKRATSCDSIAESYPRDIPRLTALFRPQAPALDLDNRLFSATTETPEAASYDANVIVVIAITSILAPDA
jgi:hypothetical protein